MVIACVVHLACTSPEAVRHYHVLTHDPQRSLNMAARIGDVELANLALKAGAQVNARDEAGATALMLAAHGQHDRLVKVLLDHGADPTIHDADGHTALWHARGLMITGRVPFARFGFDLHLRLPRVLQTDTAALLDPGTK
jgi:ankyrin repeat protein